MRSWDQTTFDWLSLTNHSWLERPAHLVFTLYHGLIKLDNHSKHSLIKLRHQVKSEQYELVVGKYYQPFPYPPTTLHKGVGGLWWVFLYKNLKWRICWNLFSCLIQILKGNLFLFPFEISSSLFLVLCLINWISNCSSSSSWCNLKHLKTISSNASKMKVSCVAPRSALWIFHHALVETELWRCSFDTGRFIWLTNVQDFLVQWLGNTF